MHIIGKIRSTFLLTTLKKPLHLIWKLLGFSLGLVFGNGVCVYFNSDERFHVQANPQWLAEDLGIDMLIVCNCCICNCWNCLQDNVMRYGISSYWWSRQESGYLEILLSALGRPSTQVIGELLQRGYRHHFGIHQRVKNEKLSHYKKIIKIFLQQVEIWDTWKPVRARVH